jgi:hypothetical protein
MESKMMERWSGGSALRRSFGKLRDATALAPFQESMKGDRVPENREFTI